MFFLSRLMKPWLVVLLLVLCSLSYFKFFIITNDKDVITKGIKRTILAEDVFQERESHLRDTCSAYNKGLDEDIESLAHHRELLKHILVDQEHKVLYCYVPKVACTNMKKVFLLLREGLDNHPPIENIIADSVHRDGVFPTLSTLSKKEVIESLRTYHKFMFVRHPMERLVSAFRNKFEKNFESSKYFQQRFGVKILKKYRKKGKFSSKGTGVTFPEFVQFLIDDPEKLNEHWAPFTRLCLPCLIRYDLIGKYESLVYDAEFILRKIGAPPDLHFPPLKPSKTSSVVPSYVAQLTPLQRTKLKKIFQADYSIFGYDDSYLFESSAHGNVSKSNSL